MDTVRVPKKPKRFTPADPPANSAPQQAQTFSPPPPPPPPPPPQATQAQLNSDQGRAIYESIQRIHPNCPPFEVLEAFLIAYILLKSSDCFVEPSTVVNMTLLDVPLLQSLIGSKIKTIRLGDIRLSLGVYFRNDFRDCVLDLARLVKCVYDNLISANVLSPPSPPPPSGSTAQSSYQPSPKSNPVPLPSPSTAPPESDGAVVSPSRRVTLKRSQNGKVLISYKGWGVKRVQMNFDKGTWVAEFELDMDEEDDSSTTAERPDYDKPSMTIRKVEFDGKEWGDPLARSKAEAFEFKMDRGCQVNLGQLAPLNTTTSSKTNLIGADAGARVRAFTRKLKSVGEWGPPPESSCCSSCGAPKTSADPQNHNAPFDRRISQDPWHFVDLFSKFFT